MKKLLIYAATGNKHKMREFRQIFSEAFPPEKGWEIDILPEKEAAPGYIPLPETGKTFLDNSLIKSKGLCDFLFAHPSLVSSDYDYFLVMADDSGLSVDALGGDPGVHSARYAAPEGSDTNSPDEENLMKLLRVMKDIPWGERQAQFVCAITCFAWKKDFGAPVYCSAEARVEGEITFESRGENGFGYDPVFYVERFGKTTSEMSPEEKNEISHRGKACRQAAEKVYGIYKEM